MSGRKNFLSLPPSHLSHLSPPSSLPLPIYPPFSPSFLSIYLSPSLFLYLHLSTHFFPSWYHPLYLYLSLSLSLSLSIYLSTISPLSLHYLWCVLFILQSIFHYFPFIYLFTKIALVSNHRRAQHPQHYPGTLPIDYWCQTKFFRKSSSYLTTPITLAHFFFISQKFLSSNCSLS
jgi:hypothetical protein